MKRFLWTYSVELKKTVGAGILDVNIRPAKQSILEIFQIVSFCNNPSREIELWMSYDRDGANQAIEFIDTITDSNFHNNRFIYPFQLDHVSFFMSGLPKTFILNQDDELYFQYKNCAVNETVKTFIRAWVSIYALPTITHTTDLTIENTYQNYIVGVIE